MVTRFDQNDSYFIFGVNDDRSEEAVQFNPRCVGVEPFNACLRSNERVGESLSRFDATLSDTGNPVIPVVAFWAILFKFQW